jgi:DNA-binding CsgD family transcriptional regulator
MTVSVAPVQRGRDGQPSEAGESSVRVPAAELVAALTADVLGTLGALRIPAYIVDSHRRLRWQNAASIELVGDLRGRLDASILDPEDLPRARAAFAEKQNGATHTEIEVSVARPDGTRVRVAVTSAPLKNADGTMIGSFGLIKVLGELEPSFDRAPRLSPRELETLTLLAAGFSTAQMARHMRIATETVRNHVKGVLRSLDARSRVEAVAKGRRMGLI